MVRCGDSAHTRNAKSTVRARILAGLEKLTVSPTGSVASKRKASSSALGITELVALLETADLAQPGPQRLLLSVVYTLRKAPGPVVMSALAGDIGKQLVQVLALKHRE